MRYQSCLAHGVWLGKSCVPARLTRFLKISVRFPVWLGFVTFWHLANLACLVGDRTKDPGYCQELSQVLGRSLPSWCCVCLLDAGFPVGNLSKLKMSCPVARYSKSVTLILQLGLTCCFWCVGGNGSFSFFSTLRPQENTDLTVIAALGQAFYAAFNELKAKIVSILRTGLSACVCHWR